MEGYDTCYGHRPDLAEERRRNASKGGKRGGRGRPQAELAALKNQLSGLVSAVFNARIDKGTAAVINQILNTKVRVIALERDIREQEEIVERIRRLEEVV